MSLIQNLKSLQDFKVNEAQALVIPSTTTPNLDQTQQSISLLTTELNEFTSNVKQSVDNPNAQFSLSQWVEQTALAVANALKPTITSNITNPKPLSKTIEASKEIVENVVVASIKNAELTNISLEKQVNKIIENQTKTKIERDEDGNIKIVPILSQNSITALNNIKKTLQSTINALEEVSKRLTNTNPIENINDFVNNLSLEHIISFAEKALSLIILLRQFRDIRKKVEATTAGIEQVSPSPVKPTSGKIIVENALTSEKEQQQLQDLETAYSIIRIIRELIPYFSSTINGVITQLQSIVDLIDSLPLPNEEENNIKQDVENIISQQNQNKDTIENPFDQEREIIVPIPKPYYAAKLKI